MGYKIVYIAIIGHQYGGVEQKILAQFDALKRIKKDTYLYLISKYEPMFILFSEINKRKDITLFTNSELKRKNPFLRRMEKFEIFDSILGLHDPSDTIIYLRFPLADIFFLRFLRRNKKYTFITEHQEIENRLRIGRIRINVLDDILDLLFGEATRNKITGFVGVTPEITEFEKSYVNDRKHYFITISNGINTNNYPLRYALNNNEIDELRIIFVGSGFVPHGLFRLIKSISYYYKVGGNKKQIYLKIIGDSNSMARNKKLVRRLNLESRIHFLGHIESKELGRLFNWAQVACGSLAIHKKGLKYTSELKAREYCARGLPFFWSTYDYDFGSDFPYILDIPRGNGRFSIDPIFSFVKNLEDDKNHPMKMRQYAIDHLDYSLKMNRLISFFDNIVAKKKISGDY